MEIPFSTQPSGQFDIDDSRFYAQLDGNHCIIRIPISGEVSSVRLTDVVIPPFSPFNYSVGDITIEANNPAVVDDVVVPRPTPVPEGTSERRLISIEEFSADSNLEYITDDFQRTRLGPLNTEEPGAGQLRIFDAEKSLRVRLNANAGLRDDYAVTASWWSGRFISGWNDLSQASTIARSTGRPDTRIYARPGVSYARLPFSGRTLIPLPDPNTTFTWARWEHNNFDPSAATLDFNDTEGQIIDSAMTFFNVLGESFFTVPNAEAFFLTDDGFLITRIELLTVGEFEAIGPAETNSFAVPSPAFVSGLPPLTTDGGRQTTKDTDWQATARLQDLWDEATQLYLSSQIISRNVDYNVNAQTGVDDIVFEDQSPMLLSPWYVGPVANGDNPWIEFRSPQQLDYIDLQFSTRSNAPNLHGKAITGRLQFRR